MIFVICVKKTINKYINDGGCKDFQKLYNIPTKTKDQLIEF